MAENISMNGSFSFSDRGSYYTGMSPNRMSNPSMPNMPYSRENFRSGEYTGSKYFAPASSKFMMEEADTKGHYPRSDFGRTPLDQLPLTMVYIPMQKFGKTLEPEAALDAGTLFPELEKPFLGARWSK